MKIALRHIASIQTGIFAKPVTEGEIVYLQAKHFDEDGKLTNLLYPDLKSEGISEKHFLQPGDVLFASKGTRNFAAYYEGQNLLSVASTSFFVIRLQNENVMPEYLTWYLNHPDTQKILKGRAIGTSMVSISKSVLEELEISIPDLKMQIAILKITQLRNQEKNLKQQIETLREEQIKQQLINPLK